jgi:DNA repair protein radc
MPPKRLSLRQIPEEERPRERLIQKGEQTLSDAELLAISLGSGSRTESAIQLAHRILKEAGSLKLLAEMSVSELRRFHGVGPAKAAQLKAAFELSRRYAANLMTSRPKFSSSQMVFQHFHALLRAQKQEEFWVVSLDAKNRLQHKRLVTQGTLMGSIVHPREVFHDAIRASAAGIIILHNHPSGDPAPSLEDRKVTAQIAEAGKVLGIPLLDHVIIGNNDYYSFKDAGAL